MKIHYASNGIARCNGHKARLHVGSMNAATCLRCLKSILQDENLNEWARDVVFTQLKREMKARIRKKLSSV